MDMDGKRAPLSAAGSVAGSHLKTALSTIDSASRKVATTGLELGASLLNLVAPRRCALCQQPSTAGFCHGCRELLPWIAAGCAYCGAGLDESGICRSCIRCRPPWDDIYVPLHYTEPVSGLLHGLKYHRKIQYADPLAIVLAEHALRTEKPLPDALLPIPLHSSRLRARGFNQAELLARGVGRLLGIPVDTTVIHRQHRTQSQTDLDMQDRRKNMKNAFAVSAPGRYHAVALIDDVITSGATMSAACEALHDQGYKRVSIWAVTKT